MTSSERVQLTLEQRTWTTALVLLVYLVMSQLPLFGAHGRANDPFLTQRLVLGSVRGTVMELGISPLLTSGLVTQLMASAGIFPSHSSSRCTSPHLKIDHLRISSSHRPYLPAPNQHLLASPPPPGSVWRRRWECWCAWARRQCTFGPTPSLRSPTFGPTPCPCPQPPPCPRTPLPLGLTLTLPTTPLPLGRSFTQWQIRVVGPVRQRPHHARDGKRPAVGGTGTCGPSPWATPSLSQQFPVPCGTGTCGSA